MHGMKPTQIVHLLSIAKHLGKVWGDVGVDGFVGVAAFGLGEDGVVVLGEVGGLHNNICVILISHIGIMCTQIEEHIQTMITDSSPKRSS